MRPLSFLFILPCLSSFTFAQVVPPEKQAAQHQMIRDMQASQQDAPVSGKCLPDGLRTWIRQRNSRNADSLYRAGILQRDPARTQPLFIFPLANAPGFNYPGFYAISNFVDHDGSGGTEDYNCGSRTYDGHQGTDIRISPFKWNKMANNEVWIIAAASGTIIAKDDGNFDQHCEQVSGAQWNAVYLEHSDGSRTWYGHMKNGSLTSKDVGDGVVAGEFLGLVGSSGFSTGAHLHFEVYDSNDNLVDPFSGPCNQLNGSSWWANQLPYYDSGINRLITHHDDWENFPCPQLSAINEKSYYCPGDNIVFSAHYRHDLTDNTISVKVYEPDGDLSPILNTTYSREGSYHLTESSAKWTRTLPEDGETGDWTFEAEYTSTSYGTIVYQHPFRIGLPCQPNYSFLFPHTSGNYYIATNSIQSVATVPNDLHVWYDAGDVISLQPGFQAVPGSRFVARIQGCPD